MEARVRCFASCELNGRTELVWSSFSPTLQRQCVRAKEVVEEGEEEEEDGEDGSEDKAGPAKSRFTLGSKQVGFLALLLVSALVLLLAFLLGHLLV